MQVAVFVLPTIATLALGTALLVPLRDDRRGRRATLGGVGPLRPTFSAPEFDGARSADRDDAKTTVDEADSLEEMRCETSDDEPESNPRSLDPTAFNTAEPTNSIRPLGFIERARMLILGARGSRPSMHRDGPPELEVRSAVEREGGGEGVSTEGPSTIERSFAHELSQLLATDSASDPAPSPSPSHRTANHDAPAAAHSIVLVSPSAAAQSQTIEPIVARAAHPCVRAIPLTRLPLRPLSERVTWPSELDPPQTIDSQEERHALLSSFGRQSLSVDQTILERAVRQEDRGGRMLALRALERRIPNDRTRALFQDMLRTGNDDERAFALDALVTHGMRDDVLVALTDRTDAIAARAALAYIGSATRAVFRETLAPHLDASRIETLLVLLAGIAE